MYPPTDDNYGIDSCSIMCIQTTPPIVVIAMCNGRIYHAILLKETLEEEENDKKVRYISSTVLQKLNSIGFFF